MTKTRLSYGAQVKQLRARGLSIADDDECEHFLRCVNYYRFSGYFRYWQRDPQRGDNGFVLGSSFSTIRDVYQNEQDVGGQIILALRRVELLLRTKFAHHYAQRAAACGALNHGAGLTQPTNERAPRIEDHILRDLERSKEAFVAHYRDESKRNQDGALLPSAYERIPTWVAVEALSFGTLSRCIQAADELGVLDDIADEISVSRTVLASQVKSFVYLRNRIAHHARLWNHSVLDAPMIMPKIKRRAFRDHRSFEPRSVYAVLVALDGVLNSSRMEPGWLSQTIEPILAGDRLLADGLTSPRKHGNVDLHLSGASDNP